MDARTCAENNSYRLMTFPNYFASKLLCYAVCSVIAGVRIEPFAVGPGNV